MEASYECVQLMVAARLVRIFVSRGTLRVACGRGLIIFGFPGIARNRATVGGGAMIEAGMR